MGGSVPWPSRIASGYCCFHVQATFHEEGASRCSKSGGPELVSSESGARIARPCGFNYASVKTHIRAQMRSYDSLLL